MSKIEKHHTIGFDTIEAIDWHVRHLFDDGWKVIQDMPEKKHRKKTAKDNSKRYWKRYGLRLCLKSGLAASYNGG